jgi:hypothetical protein
MNTIASITENLVAWAKAAIPALSTYDYPTNEKVYALPDAAAEIQDVSVSRENAQQFPMSQIEQVVVRSYTVNLMFLVTPDPPDTATDSLTQYVDTLTQLILDDPTCAGALGTGVIITPEFRSTFTPPFLEFDDGTRGRTATMELIIAELVSYDDLT